MATIINTLEVIIEQPRSAEPPAAVRAQPAPAPVLRPRDVEDIEERRRRQTARLSAD